MNRTQEPPLTDDEFAFDRFLDGLMTSDDGLEPRASDDLERFALRVHRSGLQPNQRDLSDDPVLARVLFLQRANLSSRHPNTVPQSSTETNLVQFPLIRSPSRSGFLRASSWAALLVLSLISVAYFALSIDKDKHRVIDFPLAGQQSGVIVTDWILNLLSAPAGIAIAPDGNLWIPIADEGRIDIYGPAGDLLDSWGEPGSEPGQLAFTSRNEDRYDMGIGIAWDSAGNIYVADRWNHRIQKFDPDRNYLLSFGSRGSSSGALESPYGIAIGPDDSIYVVDGITQGVKQFNTQGEQLQIFTGGGTTQEISMLPGPPRIAADGSVWIPTCRDNVIHGYHPDGRHYIAIGAPGSGRGEFDCPRSIAMSGDNLIYVADYGNQRIQVLDRAGTYRNQWVSLDDGSSFLPASLAIARDGSLYVLDADQGRVIKFDPMAGLP